jgi:hypothetical protein
MSFLVLFVQICHAERESGTGRLRSSLCQLLLSGMMAHGYDVLLHLSLDKMFEISSKCGYVHEGVLHELVMFITNGIRQRQS